MIVSIQNTLAGCHVIFVERWSIICEQFIKDKPNLKIGYFLHANVTSVHIPLSWKAFPASSSSILLTPFNFLPLFFPQW